MKAPPEYIEGPEAFQRFDTTMTKILSVSKEELRRRETTYQKAQAKNPTRPGPKRKVK